MLKKGRRWGDKTHTTFFIFLLFKVKGFTG